MKIVNPRAWLRAACCSLALVAAACTGCQMDINGQTLPSGYYLQDDVQYFPSGPEFKLSREAAAQKAYKAEQELEGRGGAGGGSGAGAGGAGRGY